MKQNWTNWTYGDLIDLEYFLAQDQDSSHADLHVRDRQLFLDSPEEIQNGGRDQLIHHWLQTRRQSMFSDGAARSPGQIIIESFRTLGYMLTLLGLVLGCTAGISFLAYSGTTPVNVLNFLFLFIFSQLLIIALILPAIGLRIAGYSAMPAPVVSLYASISSWFANRVVGLTARIPADKRTAYTQLAGLWKKQQSRYRKAAYWPLFTLSQYTMTGFNAGLLAATLYRLVTSDIAFGWQSTIQFGASFIHTLVKTLALPWSWIVPSEYAYPSEAEIEGSRIILKDGIYGLATQDLVSWWPFLVLCIVVYGLLFRSILLMVGRFGRKRCLRKLQLNTPAHIQLVQRMQSPLVTSQAEPAVKHHAGDDKRVATDPAAQAPQAACRTILLIPAEISEHISHDTIRGRLEHRGFTVTGYREFMAGYDADRSLVKELASREWPADAGVAAVMEAWMPPIRETMIFMRDLRSAVGPSVPVWVVLAGPSDSGGVPSRPAETDRLVWQRKIDELGDPYIELVEL